MRNRSDHDNLLADGPDALLEHTNRQSLLKWYARWNERPWGYAINSLLTKIPLFLILFIIYYRDRMPYYLEHPGVFMQEKGFMIGTGILVFFIFQRMEWGRKAFKYYLLSRIDGTNFPMDKDSALHERGRRSADRLLVRYKKWGDRKWQLTLLMAVLSPLIFIVPLYVISSTVAGNWSFKEFASDFDAYVLPAILAIFILFGALIGYLIWVEVNDNYRLFEKSNTHR